MKRLIALLLLCLLLLSGCKPAETDTIVIGTEDGGGSGYGVSAKSVLHLSDFYFLTYSATRDNNLRRLGSPMYTLADGDTYLLSDGSRILLTYNNKGVLVDTLYTSAEDGKNYGLFDILVREGVLKDSGTQPPVTEGQGGNTTQPPADGGNGGSTQTGQNTPVFSTGTFKKEAFDSGLSLYLDRTAVVAAFGGPSYFTARNFTKDSYIIDCYKLSDGGVLMLDYGYDRKSLRCAVIRDAGGITSNYLGTWTAHTKPADFIRPKVELNQITSLSKNHSPEKVYQKIGEPAWFEGSAASYQDVYLLSDGSTVYLSYDATRTKLTSAHQQTTDGKLLEVALG